MMKRLFLLAAAGCGLVAMASHWNGGRTVPVHLLAPVDAEGVRVEPNARFPHPISQVKTCGQCHEVDKLKCGSHFRTGLAFKENVPSVTVEPWFWADEPTGTAIPLSLRGFTGAYSPRDVGLSCWQWTKLFGRSFPGGGIGSDPQAMESADGAKQRWGVTGALEPNCLACHQQSGYDSSEWARQVMRENWQGAATAASRIGVVEGMNERLDPSWSIATQPENHDDHLFRVPEKTAYNMGQFDEKGRCVFAVGKPKNENCLACHSVSQKDMPSHAIMGDVHLKRGMQCIDCHKNGMDHQVATKSCAECHTGAKGAGPVPTHAGIPLVHFQKLACTVCHSGVTADGAVAQVRTSRANRIGIYGRAQWAMDVPNIIEPVFVRNDKGVVEPRRMMWPCGFYRIGKDGTRAPITPDEAAKLAGDALTVEARVEKAIALMKSAPSPIGEFVYDPDTNPVDFFYRTPTNLVPFVANEDRFQYELLNQLIPLFNDNIVNYKQKPVMLRAGQMFTVDWDSNVYALTNAPLPAANEVKVGYMSEDGKTYHPLIDAWTVEQYVRIHKSEKKLTKEIIRKALANAGDGVSYITCGLEFTLGADGKLVETAGVKEAQPLSWPVGHDVRAARQARGAAPVKCADCHTGDSQFFLGEIKPTGPVQDVEGPALKQEELLKVCGCYHTVLGSTFAMRPLLKVTLWTIFGLLCLFAVAALGVSLVKYSERLSKCTDTFVWGCFKWIVDMGLVVCLLYLLASGVIGWLCGGMAGWWLVLHMVAGGGLAGAAILSAAFHTGERMEKLPVAVAWAFWVLFAAGTVFTAVMPMMTVFGSHGQEILLWSHRCVSICFACASMAVCRLSWKKRPAKK